MRTRSSIYKSLQYCKHSCHSTQNSLIILLTLQDRLPIFLSICLNHDPMGSSQPESPFRDVLEFNSLFKQKILGAPDEYIDRWDLLNLLYKYNRCHATKYHLILQDPHPADIKWLAQLKQFDMDEATLDVAEPLRVPKNEAEKRDAYMLQEKMQTSSSDAGMDYGPPAWLGLEGFEPETQAWLSKHNIDAESPIDEQAIEDAGAKWEHSLNSLELLKNLTVGLLTGYNFQVVDAGAVGNISILDAAQQTLLRAKGKGKQDDTDLNADPFWQKPAPGGDVEVVELILRLLQCYTKETQRMEIEIDQDMVEAARRVITCAERTSEATDEAKSSLVKALQEAVNEQSKLFETYSDLSFFELLRGISEKSGIALGCLVRHVVGLLQRTERIELRTHQALQQAATNFIAHAEGKLET